MTAVTLCSLASMATDFTGSLNVTVNGTTAQHNATISIDQNGGNYNLLLKNFTYEVDGVTKNVGNIALTGIPALNAGGKTMLYADQKVAIANGDDASATWIGPSLGEVPVKVLARIMDDYAVVDFQMQLQDVVAAQFNNVGDHFQIPNSDFEDWAASSGEPDHWHGFKSASGWLASSAKGKLGKDTDVRPGTTGTYSAVVTSASTFGIINNGTMTNGQLNAGNMSATSTDNHSHMDVNSTATDNNGAPFYTALYAAPDAIKTWIKYTQGGNNNNSNHHANLSAIAFDGSYYQDPENKIYTNVAAKAVDTLIVNGDWRQLSIPFDYNTYASNNASVEAVLVTISTNAKPGQGYSGDKVWVDDMELVYNANVTNFTHLGNTISGFNPDVHEYTFTWEGDGNPEASGYALTVEGKSAVTAVNVETVENGYRVVAIATSGDLMTANAYVINYEVPAVGMPGDANEDDKVDVNDVTTTINYILSKNPSPFNYDNANVNGDNTVNVMDVTLIINLILGIH